MDATWAFAKVSEQIEAKGLRHMVTERANNMAVVAGGAPKACDLTAILCPFTKEFWNRKAARRLSHVRWRWLKSQAVIPLAPAVKRQ